MTPLGFDSTKQIVLAVSSAEKLCYETGMTCFVMSNGEALTVLTQEQMNSLRLPTSYVVRYCTG